MFGDFQPRAGQDEGGGGGDVEGVLAVAAGAAGVDGVIGVVEGASGFAHGGREGGDLLDRLAADTQGGDGGGDLGRGRLAAQAGGEEGVGLVRRQDAAVDEFGQQRLESLGHLRPSPCV